VVASELAMFWSCLLVFSVCAVKTGEECVIDVQIYARVAVPTWDVLAFSLTSHYAITITTTTISTITTKV
jgi:hypothetical protein